MNGSTMERELMAVLRDHSFIPIRAPGSGTGDWDLPDVLAAQQGVLMAGELKSGADPRNLEPEEVQALQRVADAYWAAALAVVRYKGDRTFYLTPVDALERTESGNFSLPQESNLPWTAALPYTKGDDGVEARTGVGDHGIVYATDDPPPTLADYLDAVTASQQGYNVRRGVVDLDEDDLDPSRWGQEADQDE
jgi:Holliday junction resolvase